MGFNSPQPIGIIHFLGGAFVATAPNITYAWLLEELAKDGYVIINVVSISPKFQVIIPLQPIEKMRGFLKGIETTKEREMILYECG